MLIEKVNLVGTSIDGDLLKDRMKKEYTPLDYVLPVSFVTLLTLFGMMMLLLGWVIYGHIDDSYSSVFFSGSEFWLGKALETERRTVAIMAFSIMGSYISASQYIYRRFSTIDLTPGNFFSVGLRMILAALVSLMLSYVFDHTLVVETDLILVVAFLTGIFPDTGFKILLKKTKIFSSARESEAVNYSLDLIEGVSEMHKIRLYEIGIDNVQNLAQFNFFMLIIKTPFPVRTLLDWMSQAKLIIEFQEDFHALQKVGVRSVTDYLDAVDGNRPELFEEISRICGIEKLALEVNYKNISNDQSVTLLMHFRKNLESLHLD